MLHRNGKSQWLAPWLAARLEWGQGDKWTINNRCNCSKSACFKMFQWQSQRIMWLRLLAHCCLFVHMFVSLISNPL